MVDVTEGVIAVGDTGKNLDTTVVEQDQGGDAHREVVVLADPSDNDARASVTAGIPNLDSYGGTVHDPMMESISITLDHILEELKKQTLHLNYMTELEK